MSGPSTIAGLTERLKSFSNRVLNRGRRPSVYLPLDLNDHGVDEHGVYSDTRESRRQQEMAAHQPSAHTPQGTGRPTTTEGTMQPAAAPTPSEELHETQAFAREAAALLWEALALKQQEDAGDGDTLAQMLDTCHTLSRRLNAAIGDLMGEVDECTLALAVEASDMLATVLREHEAAVSAAPEPAPRRNSGLDDLPPSDLRPQPALATSGHAFEANHFDEHAEMLRPGHTAGSSAPTPLLPPPAQPAGAQQPPPPPPPRRPDDDEPPLILL